MAEVYCICREGAAGFMICCDGCEEWFHGKCVGVHRGSATEKADQYFCPNCTQHRNQAPAQDEGDDFSCGGDEEPGVEEDGQMIIQNGVTQGKDEIDEDVTIPDKFEKKFRDFSTQEVKLEFWGNDTYEGPLKVVLKMVEVALNFDWVASQYVPQDHPKTLLGAPTKADIIEAKKELLEPPPPVLLKVLDTWGNTPMGRKEPKHIEIAQTLVDHALSTQGQKHYSVIFLMFATILHELSHFKISKHGRDSPEKIYPASSRGGEGGDGVEVRLFGGVIEVNGDVSLEGDWTLQGNDGVASFMLDSEKIISILETLPTGAPMKPHQFNLRKEREDKSLTKTKGKKNPCLQIRGAVYNAEGEVIGKI